MEIIIRSWIERKTSNKLNKTTSKQAEHTFKILDEAVIIHMNLSKEGIERKTDELFLRGSTGVCSFS